MKKKITVYENVGFSNLYKNSIVNRVKFDWKNEGSFKI